MSMSITSSRTVRTVRRSHRRRLAALAGLAVVGALATPVPAAMAATTDSDHDGLSNAYERDHRLDPRDEDTDNDGMDDGDEVRDGRRSTNPLRADTDRDGIRDGDEDADHDGIDNEDEDDALETCVNDDDDRDGDHVDDEDENDVGTRAGNPDSDGDGVPDGEEVARGHHVANEDLDDAPGDRCVRDRDSDGEDDEDHGDYLGTIASFDQATGVLAVTTESTTLTYVIDAGTEIGFEGAGDGPRAHEGGEGGEGGVSGSDDRRLARSTVTGDDDHDDDHGGEGRDGDEETEGTVADLVPGTLVAEVKVDRDGSVREVELYASSPA